jgi:hypothetical protein
MDNGGRTKARDSDPVSSRQACLHLTDLRRQAAGLALPRSQLRRSAEQHLRDRGRRLLGASGELLRESAPSRRLHRCKRKAR